MQVFGWIGGQYLQDNIYLYQQTPLFTYKQVPAVLMEIGTTSGGYGQDFNAFSPIAA